MPNAIHLCKISFKGQVTIPKTIRKNLNVDPGDYIFFLREGNKTVLKKAKLSVAEEFDKLTFMIDKKVKELGIKDRDIKEAIKWARRK